MTRVMIAVDGSDLDAELAAAAHRLFGDTADYWAVNVQHFDGDASGFLPVPVPAMYGGALVGYGTAYPYLPPEPYTVGDDAASGDESGRAEESARQVANRAGIADAEVVAEIGDPPTAILRAAREHNADVIVVGNHERGWWSKLLVPSVTDDLLDTSTTPVLVIKRDESGESSGAAT